MLVQEVVERPGRNMYPPYQAESERTHGTPIERRRKDLHQDPV